MMWDINEDLRCLSNTVHDRSSRLLVHLRFRIKSISLLRAVWGKSWRRIKLFQIVSSLTQRQKEASQQRVSTYRKPQTGSRASSRDCSGTSPGDKYVSVEKPHSTIMPPSLWEWAIEGGRERKRERESERGAALVWESHHSPWLTLRDSPRDAAHSYNKAFLHFEYGWERSS